MKPITDSRGEAPEGHEVRTETCNVCNGKGIFEDGSGGCTVCLGSGRLKYVVKTS